MEFVPGKLREQHLTEVGYTVVQVAGNLEYPNCRLVRMDYDWKCKGVTHEYWDGKTSPIPRNVCYINDRNDGGCKSDKFERDAKLLEKGLKDEPTNVRYMFYLAQTYHSLGRWKDSIAMYKKRIAGGGWFEEVWFSHYMIGQCYLSLKDPIRFEGWMLRAYKYHPHRAESIYKLTRHFRENAEHYKAYHYADLGSRMPKPNDSLFIENDVYNGLFDYEKSILDYYVKSDKREGLRDTIRYLLKGDAHAQNVISNLKFYVQPIVNNPVEFNFPSPFGDKYRSSAISLDTHPYANVRWVNYWIEDGEYKTPDNEPVMTENAYTNLETGEVICKMNDASVGLPRRDVRVKGLEDIRLCDGKFTATVQEYSEGVRVLYGDYNKQTGTYDNCKVLESPNARHCEKNWLMIPGTDDIIYDWFPFQILGKNAVSYDVPPLFKYLRGSAPPFKNGDEWWVLVHIVEYSKPRVYYHCFVKLDEKYKPKSVSLPFVFRSPTIEYCVCATPNIVYFSTNDKDSAWGEYSQSSLEWISI
jgi:tetratricopeptide (TPR) repeat protein